MQRCLELAALGSSWVAPNPMVGALLTRPDQDNRIVAEAFHGHFGGPHAEARLLDALDDSQDFQQTRLYVNLEPCSHHGKTPPCADRIIQAGIPEVVVAALDPNPRVAGRGIARLRDAGIEVRTGILEKEARQLNAAFYRRHQRERPYVILKWAQSADGYLTQKPGVPTAITHAMSNRWVHALRSRCQAILVGARTVAADDPLLNLRHWPGRDPQVVIADRNLLLESASYRVFQRQPHRLFAAGNLKRPPKEEEIPVEDWEDADQWLEALAQRDILSLLVEGGANTLKRFLHQELWDEIWIFTDQNQYWGKGLAAPRPATPPNQSWQLGSNQITYWFQNNP